MVTNGAQGEGISACMEPCCNRIKGVQRTFPPVFMPNTAELRAGGGLGPPAPAKSPFAVSVIFFTAAPATVPPATNSMGCRKHDRGQRPLESSAITQVRPRYTGHIAWAFSFYSINLLVDGRPCPHLRDGAIAAEEPGLPARYYINALVHTVKVNLDRNGCQLWGFIMLK
jgi:hypothetical protein